MFGVYCLLFWSYKANAVLYFNFHLKARIFEFLVGTWKPPALFLENLERVQGGFQVSRNLE